MALAGSAPGAWVGIKIAALLLVLEGQRPGWICDVLGLTRMSLSRWIHRVNAPEAGVCEFPLPVRIKDGPMKRSRWKNVCGGAMISESGLPTAARGSAPLLFDELSMEVPAN